MPPTLVLRLAADPAYRSAVCQDPAQTLAPLGLSPLQQRLLHLVARRLHDGRLPPVCAYWWNGDAALERWPPPRAAAGQGDGSGLPRLMVASDP